MTDLPAPNIPLLRKAIEWAEAEAAKTDPTQREWDQKFWAQQADCGTSYCIAGYVTTAACEGATLSDTGWGDYDLLIDGQKVSWGDTARHLLGITYEEADDLFEANNTIADVRRLAEQIAARAGERL